MARIKRKPSTLYVEDAVVLGEKVTIFHRQSIYGDHYNIEEKGNPGDIFVTLKNGDHRIMKWLDFSKEFEFAEAEYSGG